MSRTNLCDFKLSQVKLISTKLSPNQKFIKLLSTMRQYFQQRQIFYIFFYKIEFIITSIRTQSLKDYSNFLLTLIDKLVEMESVHFVICGIFSDKFSHPFSVFFSKQNRWSFVMVMLMVMVNAIGQCLLKLL